MLEMTSECVARGYLGQAKELSEACGLIAAKPMNENCI